LGGDENDEDGLEVVVKCPQANRGDHRLVREVDPPRPGTKVSTAEGLPNIAAGRRIGVRVTDNNQDWWLLASPTMQTVTVNGGTVSLRADADTTFQPASFAVNSNSTIGIQVNSLNSPAGDGHTLTLTGQTVASSNNDVTLNVTSTTGDTLKFNTSAVLSTLSRPLPL